MFHFYITDLHNGKVTGTDDRDLALSRAQCEEYFVLEPAENKWLTSNGPVEVEEAE
jgi:hypothetical protein